MDQHRPKPILAPRRALLAALLAASALASPAFAQPAFAQPGGQMFDIPAEPVGEALKAFGRSANEQLIYAPELARGVRSHAVQGRFSPDAALDQLLQDTGLAWRRAPAGGILIERRTDARPPAAGATAAAEPPTALEELVVTGTHIEGAAPVGARPVVLDQGEILRIGRGNVADLLRALPQDTGLGAGEEARGAIQASQVNLGFAASPNLRGLGTDATLSLLDGVRLPPTSYGGLVDISQIPAIALERVEVLADGASAIYGSDAVGGVVNFILKRDVEGGELRVRAGAADHLDDEIVSGSQGHRWASGSVFAAVEYEHRSSLPASARSFMTDDLRAFGGPDLRLLNATPGNISANGTTYAIPAGQNGIGLTPEQLVAGTKNLDNRWIGGDILPSTERVSGALTFRQELSPWASVFLEGLGQSRVSERRETAFTTTLVVPRSNPFFVSPNPGSSSVNVAYNFGGDFGVLAPRADVQEVLLTGGLKLDLAARWHATVQGTYAHDRVRYGYHNIANLALVNQALADPDRATAFNPFGDAGSNPASVLNRVRGYISEPSHVGYTAVDAGASGPVLRLPGGEARLALGAEQRREHLVTATDVFYASTTPIHGGVDDSRTVDAAYVEADLPLLGPDNAIAFARRLELSGALRSEHYSDAGESTNPRFGLDWEPVRDLRIFASWGTSFKAPTLYQKDTSTNSIYSFQAAIPTAPGGIATLIALGGKAPDLSPEKAETWTLGLDWRPHAWAGLQLGVHYFNVRYRDRILAGTASEVIAALQSPASNPLIVERSPSAASVAAYYASPLFSATAPRPPASQIFAVVDLRQQNLGAVEQSGYDLSAAYARDAAGGRLQISANAVYIARYAVDRVPGRPFLDLLNTNSNPLDWRGEATLSWSSGPWDAALRANYVAGYRNTLVVPSQAVSSWTTFDLHLAYAPASGLLARQGVRLALDVQNLFDRDPPRMANLYGPMGYDTEEASALGRFASVTLSKTW